MIDATPYPAVTRFRELHNSGCFVLPNPWDVGTARYLERIGYHALATTSAGMSFAHGLPDSVSSVGVNDMLFHIRDIVSATALPVNADFQNGYAHEPEKVYGHVLECVATGAAGLSIEDATGEHAVPLYERGLAIARVHAARGAIDKSGIPVVLTARCEAFLVDHAEPLRTVLDRLVAYAEAGADCLYAPGVRKMRDVEEIVKAVAPKPVNVLALPTFTVAALAEAGVRRVSIGSAMARVAWGAFMRSARAILENGSFESFAEAVPFAEINDILFTPRRLPEGYPYGE